MSPFMRQLSITVFAQTSGSASVTAAAVYQGKGDNDEGRTAEGTPVASEAGRRVYVGSRVCDGARQADGEVHGDGKRTVDRRPLDDVRGAGRDARWWDRDDGHDARL